MDDPTSFSVFVDRVETIDELNAKVTFEGRPSAPEKNEMPPNEASIVVYPETLRSLGVTYGRKAVLTLRFLTPEEEAEDYWRHVASRFISNVHPRDSWEAHFRNWVGGHTQEDRTLLLRGLRSELEHRLQTGGDDLYRRGLEALDGMVFVNTKGSDA